MGTSNWLRREEVEGVSQSVKKVDALLGESEQGRRAKRKDEPYSKFSSLYT